MMLGSLLLLAMLQTPSLPVPQQAVPPVPAALDLSKPLPPVAELLDSVERHEDANEAAMRQYTYHVHHVMDDFDGSDDVKKTSVTDMESFTVNGVRLNRVTSRDGKPLDAEETKKETERIDKAIAKARETKSRPDAETAGAKGEGKAPLISASRMLQLGTFSNEHRILLNGRPTIVLDYAGNREVKTKNSAEGIVKDLVGTVWIDEADRVLARVEGHFLADFKLGFGLLVDIHKGLTFTMQQKKINDEVWLRQKITGEGKASVGVFVIRVHGRALYEMSDFRKFRTGATILPGSQAIGGDGKPLQQEPEASGQRSSSVPGPQ